ncbi:ATP-dependent DNA helicase UvrD/PcrA/Rep, epsilon proteobacterial type 1 [Campylobacter jejuni]|nr:ATP-dependent DNA helicase UvrD/PcrA/Rep, epsilon proteobacterial type 1 [Campylobacter jejuni]
MIGRLGKFFDKNITSKILAGTFHSTAYTLLRNADKNIALKQASELKTLLKSVYEKRTFRHLSDIKPYQSSYLYDLYSLFQTKRTIKIFILGFAKTTKIKVFMLKFMKIF